MQLYPFLLVCYLKMFKDLEECITNTPKKSGIDQRYVFYPNTVKIDNTTTEQLIQIYNNKSMIDYLESDKITLHNKLYKISERNYPEMYNINIFNGGLFNNWNFDNDFLDE